MCAHTCAGSRSILYLLLTCVPNLLGLAQQQPGHPQPTLHLSHSIMASPSSQVTPQGQSTMLLSLAFGLSALRALGAAGFTDAGAPPLPV